MTHLEIGIFRRITPTLSFFDVVLSGNNPSEYPDFLTHYYCDEPFRSLSDLEQAEVAKNLDRLEQTRTLRRRLSREYRDFYFRERRRFERVMYEQFVAKGGRPRRERPHYLILGESEIWAEMEPRSVRIPLEAVPREVISFTYTDSWCAYVDRTLTGLPMYVEAQVWDDAAVREYLPPDGGC